MELDQKTYEIGYLLTPLLPEDKVAEKVSVLRKLIDDNSGFIMSEDHARMQRLAYPIARNNSAYFGRIKFYAKSEAVDKIKESFEKSDETLRFLLTKTSKETAARPSRKIRKIVKPAISTLSGEEKKPIKPEEIDKKLEELIREPIV